MIKKFQLLTDNYAAFAAKVGREDVDGFIKQSFTQDLMRTVYLGYDSRYQELKERIMASKMPFADEVVSLGMMERNRRDKNYVSFVHSAKNYARKYAWKDWSALNQIAWEIYEDKEYSGRDYLKLAKRLTKRSIKLDENYYNTDTLAAVLYKSQKYKPAIKWAEKAVDIARKSGDDYSVTKELINKIRVHL